MASCCRSSSPVFFEPAGPKVPVQFDLRRPTIAVEGISGEVECIEGNGRQTAGPIINFCTGVGDERVKIGRPDNPRVRCFH